MDLLTNLRLQTLYKKLKHLPAIKIGTIHEVYNVINTSFEQIDIIEKMLPLGDDYIKEQAQQLRGAWIKIAKRSTKFLHDSNSYKVDDIVINSLNMIAKEFLQKTFGQDLVKLSNSIKKNNNQIDYRIIEKSGFNKYHIISLFQCVKYFIMSEGKMHSIEFEYISQIIDCLEEYWVVD